MAWNEPGKGNQHDPWGGGRKSEPTRDNQPKGNHQAPPDLDEALKKLQEKLNSLFGNQGGGGGNRKQPPKLAGFGLAGLVLVIGLAIWLASGFYLVDQAERAVTLRLGKYNETLTPGLHWNPPVIDKVYKINTTRLRSFHQEATMLTQDENIVQVSISIQYVVNNPRDYLLNVRTPEKSLEFALDSSLRHEVGTTDLIQILTEGREVLAQGVKERLQRYLDYYKIGFSLEAVNIESTQAPNEVQSAFDDVIRAREDRERSINQARTYENAILPEAEGRAARIREEAQAYRQAVTARAEGEASRFVALLTEYQQAPEVTRERLYLSAMQNVLSNSSKLLVDTQEGSNNMFYLPLDKLNQGAAAPRLPSSGNSTQPRLSEQDLEQLTNQVIQGMREERSNTNFNIRREGR